MEANELFFRLPASTASALQAAGAYYWNETESSARLVASFDTTQDDVDSFVAAAKNILAK